MTSFAQITFAAAVLAAFYGTFIGLTPPNPPKSHSSKAPPPSDFAARYKLTVGPLLNLTMLPQAILAAHLALLALTYPNIPPWLLGHHARLNHPLTPSYITWSHLTTLPLLLILLVGVPLRLIPYATLGKNFTFALSPPEKLITTGIYKYAQHPAYTGAMFLLTCPMFLYYRLDGVMGCWVPDSWIRVGRFVERVLVPACVAFWWAIMFKRVSEEEAMLQGKFGEEWERWHRVTARFFPGIF